MYIGPVSFRLHNTYVYLQKYTILLYYFITGIYRLQHFFFVVASRGLLGPPPFNTLYLDQNADHLRYALDDEQHEEHHGGELEEPAKKQKQKNTAVPAETSEQKNHIKSLLAV